MLSATSFALLSGAGIVKGSDGSNGTAVQKIYTHQVYDLVVEKSGTKFYAELPADIRDNATLVVSKEAPVYATTLDSAGAPKFFLSAIGETEIKKGADYASATAITVGNQGIVTLDAADKVFFELGVSSTLNRYTDGELAGGETVRIDCYTAHDKGAQELQIDAENFAGYYYIEADTLFRDEATGRDLPAQFIIPRGKIQSNFTFTMANSGDPSTFTFTIDAFPGYTKFNKRKKVMAALQIIDPTEAGHNYADKTVIGHDERTGDEDTYIKSLYTKSVFDQIEGTQTPAQPANPSEPAEPSGD